MRRHLPTLTSLTCFEASARHLSFTRAAEDVNLTQSAVSRQVRNLEEFLRTPLFHRIKKRLELTEQGRAYMEVISGHLDQLEAESLRLITKAQEDPHLNLATFPTIGSHWLIPRLPDFSARHPEIPYNLTTGLLPFDLSRQEIDVAIQHGEGDWPGVVCTKLFDEEVVAACSPTLIAGRQVTGAEAVLDYTLLNLKTRSYAWREWLEAKDIPAPDRLSGPQFETFGFMIRAALAGIGVAIVTKRFVEEELRDGRLVSPFGAPVKSRRGYFMVHRAEQAGSAKVKAFVEWMRDDIIERQDLSDPSISRRKT